MDALAESVIEESRAYTRRLTLIAELCRHREMEPPSVPDGHEGTRSAWTREELTAAEIQGPLRVSAPLAARLVSRAMILSDRLSGTLEQLATGILDGARADAIADALAPVLDAVHATTLQQTGSPRLAHEATQAAAQAFEARVLGRAPQQSLDLLHASLRRAVIALAPDYEEARRAAREATREVFVTSRGEEAGMAFLGARLPVIEAQACYAELDTCARAARRHGDERTLDALRADLLVQRILQPVAQTLPQPLVRPLVRPGSSSPTQTAPATSPDERGGGWMPGRVVARGVKAHVQITISLETLLGLDEHAADLSGHGPIPAQVARHAALQAGSVWRRLVTDPYTGQLLDYARTTYRPPTALTDKITARDVHCTHPGCHHPAEHCDLDHLIPYPLGSTAEHNLTTRCRRHHRLKHQTGWTIHPSDDPDDPPGTLTTTSRTGYQQKTHPPDLRPDTPKPPAPPKAKPNPPEGDPPF